MRWAVAALVAGLAAAQCANSCSGRGRCDSYGQCHCQADYRGGDCSLRRCPTGRAWADHATGVDEAHGLAECSNRGECDTGSGECSCEFGFEGRACERTACPNGCSAHGECVSLDKLAARDPDAAGFVYEAPWDAPKIVGCVCDDGWTGYDCSQRTCPTGDDPNTTGQEDEVQLLECLADSGFLTLAYEGYTTALVNASAGAGDVEAALEALRSVGDVSVSYSEAGGSLCQTGTANIVQVTFLTDFGSLRALEVNGEWLSDPDGVTVTADGSVYGGYQSVKGSKEEAQCSNRGSCSDSSGLCTCFTDYTYSDGRGSEGTRDDCGAFVGIGDVSVCPGSISCSGHGWCDETTYTCQCADGWASGDCADRTCPVGWSWFSYPSADDTAHDTLTECSDRGTCSRSTGECECMPGYTGAACEQMACPDCHGHGRCLDMAQLAVEATDRGNAADYTYGDLTGGRGATWDRHRVFGCSCDAGWTGYDCSLRTCPTGDDAATYDDVSESQLLQCTADSGSFTLAFRGQTSPAIAFDANATDVRDAVAAAAGVARADVTVALAGGASLCSLAGAVVANVTFATLHGDLPPLQPDVSLLADSSEGGADGTGAVLVAEDGAQLGGFTSVKGTREDEECSLHGLCDRDLGTCSCFIGWDQSDGQGGKGAIRDCGYRSPRIVFVEEEEEGADDD